MTNHFSPKKNCQHVKKNGSECEAFPMHGEEYCFLHNPAIPDSQKKEIQTKGGKNSRITILEALTPMVLKEPDHVLGLLEDTVNRVRDGTMDVKIANCIGFLSGHILKSFEISDLKRKVDLLESFFSQKR
ncbi:hypothetical protein HZA38_03030 [Candidatus Peregrinibacteria bacterium]|nr:hypothetical protein [Candidatus Peregrinibacteria bacterium]